MPLRISLQILDTYLAVKLLRDTHSQIIKKDLKWTIIIMIENQKTSMNQL